MAGFNINNFRAQGLQQGGARPSNFAVSLTFPDAINTNAGLRSPFLVNAASLPSSVIQPIEVSYFGRKIKINGERIFEDWTVTVMNDEDMVIRNALEEWHNSMNSIISNTLSPDVSNINPSIGNSYKVDAIVTQFAKEGPGDFDGPGAIKTYKFNGMFPVSVGQIGLNWGDANNYETFDVVFTYDWWEPMIAANDQPIFDIEPEV